MATFALIAEGITDQIVIENILIGCLTEGEEEPEVNRLQPLRDSTGQSAAPAPGGWTLVFEYLRLGKHLEALQNSCKRNPSLQVFVEQVEAIRPPPAS